ncbi:cutinase family protein [Rhodococcus sp. NPDC003382]
MRPFRTTVLSAAALAALSVPVLAPVAAAAPGSGSSLPGSGPVIHPDNAALDCPDLLIVAVSGATDSTADRNPVEEETRQLWSNWVGNVTVPAGEANSADPGSVGWMYVPYPSTYGLGLFEDVPTYQDSVAAGVASTNRILDEQKTRCGDSTRFVLVGYSVGGEVVERVTRELGHRPADAHVSPDDVAGVVLIGDPYRPAGADSFGEPGPAGGGFMSSEPADYGALADRVRYSCRPYDIACDAPEDIAILELALGVLGQMRFTLANPLQTITDGERVISAMAARAAAHIVSEEDWWQSDESLLDVLRTVADQSRRVPGEDRGPERLRELLDWAMGPGMPVVQEKLRAEGAGFVEDNSGVVDLVLKPYIFLAFFQHIAYWNNNPNDPWYWESEKIVDWISELARAERGDELARAERDRDPAGN